MDKEQSVKEQLLKLQRKIDKMYRKLKNNADDTNLENQKINAMFGGRRERRKMQKAMGISFSNLFKSSVRDKTLNLLREKNKITINP